MAHGDLGLLPELAELVFKSFGATGQVGADGLGHKAGVNLEFLQLFSGLVDMAFSLIADARPTIAPLAPFRGAPLVRAGSFSGLRKNL